MQRSLPFRWRTFWLAGFRGNCRCYLNPIIQSRPLNLAAAIADFFNRMSEFFDHSEGGRSAGQAPADTQIVKGVWKKSLAPGSHRRLANVPQLQNLVAARRVTVSPYSSYARYNVLRYSSNARRSSIDNSAPSVPGKPGVLSNKCPPFRLPRMLVLINELPASV